MVRDTATLPTKTWIVLLHLWIRHSGLTRPFSLPTSDHLSTSKPVRATDGEGVEDKGDRKNPTCTIHNRLYLL